jgi:tetratricopeptide (TPR) repeat protein/TolB-like protein
MGIVYRAEDTKLNRRVALKFLPADSISEQDKRRFLNEARAAAAAHHPNICPIYDIEDEGARVFIAMALLEGQTLLQKIVSGPMEVQEALSIAIQIASGLDCAHSLGIVHRDIKSGNIMVDLAGHAVIMDFGLALRPDETRLTMAGSTLGTPGYMSPEQAQGQAVDARTDIWSLGVLIFEMLTGVLPFRRDSSIATIHAIVFDPATPVNSLRVHVPDGLARIIAKALAKRPEDRYQTIRELATDLKQIEAAFRIDGLAETQTMLLKHLPAPTAHRSHKSRIVFVAVAALLVIVSVPGYLYFAKTRQEFHAPEPAGNLAFAPQVAVLPFEVRGNDEKTRTIADGLVEVLTGALSDGKSSSKGQQSLVTVPAGEIQRRAISTPAEARRVFGVNYVVTFSAQPVAESAAAGKINFTLRLIDAATLAEAGSQTFVYDPASPIKSRDRAVTTEMKLLHLDLTPTETKSVRAGDTATPAAYSSYLRGRGLLGRYDIAGNVDKAMALFQDALQQDPNYALAWAGLAEASLRKARETGDKKWSETAITDAQRAVRLDGSLALVHSVLGQVYASAGRAQEAVGELKRAIEIAPGNAEAPRALAGVYTNLGRFQEAEASYIQATKSRPTDWYSHYQLGLFYYGRERYAEAETELRKARDLTPDNDLVYRNLGGILNMQGRYPEAIEQYQHSLKIKSDARTYAALGTAFFYEHRFQDAVAAVESAIDLDSNVYFFWGNAGIYYKWTKGSEQKSGPSLQRALELGRKYLETAPSNYEVMADLAEYLARLGDSKEALAELGKIPVAPRKPLASRIALVYELAGQRRDAIELIKGNLTTAASLNQIRDDPDLTRLWNSPEMRQIAARAH